MSGKSSDPRRALEATGKYRILGELGAGAMGVVYDAEHLLLKEPIAIKVLNNEGAIGIEPADLARARERMLREAKACMQLDHPNLLRVLDFGITPDGCTYLVSERLYGRTLRAEMKERGTFPVVAAIHIVCKILEGMDAAHRAKIVHRDLKPENIMITEAALGREGGLKVLDFGLAKILDAGVEEGKKLTATGSVMGTPRFMSPEAALGQKDIDARADLYAVGAILYLLLAGRGMFDHVKGNIMLILMAQRSEQPLPPSAHASQGIPPDLDRAVLKSVAKAPEERFQSAREFILELRRIEAALERPSAHPDALSTSQRWDSTEEIATQHKPRAATPPKTAKGTVRMDDAYAAGHAYRASLAGPPPPAPPPPAATAELPRFAPTTELPPSVAPTISQRAAPTIDLTLSGVPATVQPATRRSPKKKLPWVAIAVVAIVAVGILAIVLILRIT